jgi:chemosensory pili system protein ChpA (sensor histidine kinase/response regulator)
VTDSLVKLHPPSESLARAMSRVIESTVSAGQAPRPELALEFATAVLYLEAVFDDFDPNDPQLWARTARLAERLESVRGGGQAQPLESWMEQLYQRVNDKQTMGSVVGELHASLAALEKSLDLFFRTPEDTQLLAVVPRQLAQMQGVLSMLGLDQAALAVTHMRELVESLLKPGRRRTAGPRGRHLRPPRQQPGRAELPDRHAQLPARAGQAAVCLRCRQG